MHKHQERGKSKVVVVGFPLGRFVHHTERFPRLDLHRSIAGIKIYLSLRALFFYLNILLCDFPELLKILYSNIRIFLIENFFGCPKKLFQSTSHDFITQHMIFMCPLRRKKESAFKIHIVRIYIAKKNLLVSNAHSVFPLRAIRAKYSYRKSVGHN